MRESSRGEHPRQKDAYHPQKGLSPLLNLDFVNIKIDIIQIATKHILGHLLLWHVFVDVLIFY